MNTIWKYRIPVSSKFTLSSPEGSQYLTVQMQRGYPVVWALCEADNECVDYTFYTFGTGYPLDMPEGVDIKYLGTYQVEGLMVYHLFQEVSGS